MTTMEVPTINALRVVTPGTFWKSYAVFCNTHNLPYIENDFRAAKRVLYLLVRQDLSRASRMTVPNGVGLKNAQWYEGRLTQIARGIEYLFEVEILMGKKHEPNMDFVFNNLLLELSDQRTFVAIDPLGKKILLVG